MGEDERALSHRKRDAVKHGAMMPDLAAVRR
jgi:hypothetical protein